MSENIEEVITRYQRRCGELLARAEAAETRLDEAVEILTMLQRWVTGLDSPDTLHEVITATDKYLGSNKATGGGEG